VTSGVGGVGAAWAAQAIAESILELTGSSTCRKGGGGDRLPWLAPAYAETPRRLAGLGGSTGCTWSYTRRRARW
jgi:hypothetical protein